MHLSRDSPSMHLPPLSRLICSLFSKCMSLKGPSLYASLHLYLSSVHCSPNASLKRLSLYAPPSPFSTHLFTVFQVHVSQETLPLCISPPLPLICSLFSKYMSLKRLSLYAPPHLYSSSVHCTPNACLSRGCTTMHLPTLKHLKSTFFVRYEDTPAVNANTVVVWDSISSGLIHKYQQSKEVSSSTLMVPVLKTKHVISDTLVAVQQTKRHHMPHNARRTRPPS